jgi:predicted dehydrogenase
MSQRRYRVAIVGFGKIGADYADDPAMASHYPYATHAQALVGHDRFDWCAVVDPRADARAQARDRWKVPLACATAAELAAQTRIDVAVIATPPEARMDVIESIPGLRAVIVEKPLGRSLDAARSFAETCEGRGILAEVNYWRRFDESLRALADGELRQLVGIPQAVFGLYGNGLRNNGSHMIDLCNMLFGPVVGTSAIGGIVRRRRAPIDGDIEASFSLQFESGLRAVFQPVDFSLYRENSLDIWGTTGRLQLVQEGLRLMHSGVCANRAMSGEREIASDRQEIRTTTAGQAFLRLYDHLAGLLDGDRAVISPLSQALKTEAIVEAICLQAATALPPGSA